MGFIDRPRRIWWRKVVFQVHLWVGILLSLYVVVISISGSALVFHDEIIADPPTLIRQPSNTVTRSLTSLVAVAQKLYPDYRLAEVQDESWRGKAVHITLLKGTQKNHRLRRDLYIDPTTGQLLADRTNNSKADHPIYSFVADLHINLLSGRAGRKINAICAALLLLLCVTGIVVWWPGTKNWKQALTIKRRAKWPRVNYDSHRAIGFWTLLMVSMWAFTGFSFGYGKVTRTLLGTVLPFKGATSSLKSDWNSSEPILPIDTLSRRAQQEMPSERVWQIIFPSSPNDAFYVVFYPSRTPAFMHDEIVALHPATGKVLWTKDSWKENKVGDNFIRFSTMLHDASFDSLPLKLLFALLGLSPAVLTVTGILMWWSRSISKRWKLLRKEKPISVG